MGCVYQSRVGIVRKVHNAHKEAALKHRLLHLNHVIMITHVPYCQKCACMGAVEASVWNITYVIVNTIKIVQRNTTVNLEFAEKIIVVTIRDNARRD